MIENSLGGTAIEDTGGISSLLNHGSIDGAVTLAAGDSLTNTGEISGDLNLGASDTLSDQGGSIGAITDSSADLLGFKGNFGAVTIENFDLGGATNDILLLMGDGFSNFAALQPSISQVGANTLIAVNATSTITLDNTNASSLTASQFKF